MNSVYKRFEILHGILALLTAEQIRCVFDDR